MPLRYSLMPLAALIATPLAAQQPDQPDTYAPQEVIRAEFSLDERSEKGGRTTPFFTSYRPSLSFEGGQQVICRFSVATSGGHQPGTTGQIGMTCPMAVKEGQVFTAYERKRLIGTGIVLPRPRAD